MYKCWICGKQATRTNCKEKISANKSAVVIEKEPNEWIRCYCEKCLAAISQQDKEEKALYIKLKKREMFKKACDILENQHTKMYEWKEAIDTVCEHIENNPDKYDSSYEVLAAIILIQNRIRCKMQYKIGKYQIDFLLPELMVVLEIDGERHNHRKRYDYERDVKIQNVLGAGWEIIRIDTAFLDKDAKQLPKAIFSIIDEREKQRQLI